MQAASFFEHQQLARRNTRVMVLLFALALLAIVATVDVLLAGVYLWNVDVKVPRGAAYPGLAQIFAAVPTSVYVWGAIVTAGIILVVSLANMARLSAGGAAVARMVGARRVPPDTRDLLERRLLNIVEEMAIASGVRVPAVYVMDGERGINAFAAGWDVSNAIVAVTRGTLETLNRDELQGVVGHEFSHILNGDMRLNIRMIGVLAGIVFIGSIGSFLMRSGGGRDDSRDSRGAAALVTIGLALFLIGYVGLFFARLIKARVSREREFLADASSVQFTRNPEGIAGALDQIRASAAGATIAQRRAEELSHLFFGESVQMRLGSWFDTHPPIEERIERVCPGFQPSTYRNRRPKAGAPSVEAGSPAKGAVSAFAGAGPAREGRRPGDIATDWGRSATDSARMVGTVSPEKVDYAARLLASLPEGLRAGLREPDGACAALIALLLAPAEDVMQRQIQALQGAGMSALAARAREMVQYTRRLGPVFQLPVVDLALPAVKAASDAARLELLAAFQAVIQADRRVTLHEFVVLTLVRHQLAPQARPGAAGTRKLKDLRGQAGLLLTLMAHAGTRADASGGRQAELEAALRAGAKEMGFEEAAKVEGALTLDAVALALEALKGLAPLQKALLIRGLFAAVTADGAVRVAEAELMRLTGAVLECPLPPLLEELDPATLVA